MKYLLVFSSTFHGCASGIGPLTTEVETDCTPSELADKISRIKEAMTVEVGEKLTSGEVGSFSFDERYRNPPYLTVCLTQAVPLGQ